ncbi:uncharacterized protein LOC119733180 isoform X2 [Patiria miniata]|uniref:Uncharacterized protein n=1 Tax=Patiria miniata TaxID=46514 RepID=A0A914AG32_PATMI|nr:uncharacterized protein LOC119733180 isoform X2 [Patiria miniata]
MAEPPGEGAQRRNETQTNPGPSTAPASQAAATQQLPAGNKQPSQQEPTQQPPPQLQPRPGETQTNPGPSTAATQQLPADGVRDDQQTIQSGSGHPSQQEPTPQPPPQLQPRPGETQTNPGPSTAATQQLPADGVRDDQQTTQSGSGHPSQQEPTPRPPPQLQPRPGETQTNPGPSTAPASQAAATQQLPAGKKQPSQQEPTQQPQPQLQPRPVELEVEFTPTTYPHITELVLRKISERLGAEWRKLATYLGLSAAEIDRIVLDDSAGQTESQIFNMLVSWSRQQSTSTDQREVLYTALIEIGRRDIAEDLLGINDTILRVISEKLSSECKWQNLATHLGLSAAEIEHIVMDCPHQTQNQIFNMLVKWRRQQTASADQRKVLRRALIEIDRKDIAEDLLGITDTILRKISEKLSSEWQKLATHLGLSAAEIKHIVMDDPGQTENQIFNMLVKWRRQQTTSADQRKVLRTALMEISKGDIAEDLLDCPKVSIETSVARRGFNDSDLSNRLWTRIKLILDSVHQLVSAYLNPCDGELVELRRGSVTFVVRFKSREGLNKLRSLYDTGELAKKLTEILITDELTTEDKSDLAIQATIPESDYDQACRFFDELEKDQQKGISDPVLHKISERLCSEWRKLATHLGLSAAEIKHIVMDDPGQTENQIYNMLAEWRGQQSTSTDQRDVLCTALMEIGRRDIVENLLDYVMRAQEADANEHAEKRKAEATVLKDQGNQAFKKSDYTRAVELYTQGLERLKDFVVLYTNRAQAHNKLGKFSEAMEDCRTALQLEPNNVKALVHLGKAQQGLKDYEAAVTTYQEILKIDEKYEKMVAGYIAAVNLAESTAKSDMEAERLFNEGNVKASGVHEIGLSEVGDSPAALTQQSDPDDQQNSQSSNERPSHQEPTPQPPPQLQPRPDYPQQSGASIGSIGTISGSQNPVIVGSNVNITYNLPLQGPETTGHQGPGTFEDLQQEIIDNYKRTTTTIPAHPVVQSRKVDIDKFFIPLFLRKNIQGKRESKRSVRLPEGKRLLDINQTTRLNSLDDLLNPEVVKEIKILLCGGAGTGKSTLLVKVANSCITLSSKPLLGRFDLVLWIKLRQMQQSSCVLDAIFDQILARNTKLTKHIVKGFIDDHESGIALLLDGVDEIPSHVLESEEGVYRVQDILQSRVLSKSFVLVTTRPHLTEYVLSCDHQYAVVETIGFTPQDRDQYIRLNLPDDADMGDKLISNLKDNANLQEMAVVPIISQMLCIVWENQQSLPERITELYADFALALFKRRNKDMSDEQVMSNMMSIIDSLGRVALQGLLDFRGERLMFDKTEFQDCQSCLDDGCLVGFVQLENYTSGLHVNVLVTFPHKSIQEYFAACHLVKLLQDDENNFRHQLKQIGEGNVLAMEYLLRFCCGRSMQAAGFILDHIQEMQGDEEELQGLARLLMFEAGSEELATKLVRPTRVACKSNEDLKSLSYYLQHVTPPLQGAGFHMCVRKQELTILRGILLSDSMKSAGLIAVRYYLSEQEEEELILLEETLGVVDEQHPAELHVVVCIEAKSWFDVGRVSHRFFHMQEQIGDLGLVMFQRSPDEVVDLLKALEGCRLDWLTLYGTNLHARVRHVSHILSSLKFLQLNACRLVDDDVKDLISILPAGHGVEGLTLDDNAFSLDAVRALTHHLQGLPGLSYLRLRNIGLDAELVRQVVSQDLPHLKETEEGEFEKPK